MRLFPTALAALILVLLAGCDSAGDPAPTVTFTGHVLTYSGAGVRSTGPIVGAVVTAERILPDGQRVALAGQATTDADGAFSLTVDSTRGDVLLTATHDSIRRRALIESSPIMRPTVQAPSMTAQADAEAAVFLALRARNAAAIVADVAFYIDASVSNDLTAGRVTAADVAAAVDGTLRTEAAYAERAGVDPAITADARRRRNAARAQLRYARGVAATSGVGFAVDSVFADQYIDAYVAAGLSLREEARLGAAAVYGALKSTETLPDASWLSVNRRAHLYAGSRMAWAFRAAFIADGRANGEQIAEAEAVYAALMYGQRMAPSAEALLANEWTFGFSIYYGFGVVTNYPPALLRQGEDLVAVHQRRLQAAVAAATSPTEVAAALATFYGGVHAPVATLFGTDAEALVTQGLVLMGTLPRTLTLPL